MTARNVLFLLACVFGLLSMLLVYNGFYKPGTMTTATNLTMTAPS